MIDIIKSKLARGGQMNGGEIRIVVRELTHILESQQEKINELEEKLDALTRRGDRGSKKSSSKPEVRPDADEREDRPDAAYHAGQLWALEKLNKFTLSTRRANYVYPSYEDI